MSSTALYPGRGVHRHPFQKWYISIHVVNGSRKTSDFFDMRSLEGAGNRERKALFPGWILRDRRGEQPTLTQLQSLPVCRARSSPDPHRTSHTIQPGISWAAALVSREHAGNAVSGFVVPWTTVCISTGSPAD